MSQQSPDSDEKYCRECGEIIKERAEICPECGVRQQNMQVNNNQARGNQHSTQQTNRQSTKQENYGLIFAQMDAWKYQRPLRHLLNIIFIFGSLGTYLVLLVIEGLVHYRNLNAGKVEPYDESKQKVFTVFTH